MIRVYSLPDGTFSSDEEEEEEEDEEDEEEEGEIQLLFLLCCLFNVMHIHSLVLFPRLLTGNLPGKLISWRINPVWFDRSVSVSILDEEN